MKKILCCFIFLMAFQIEVRVRASGDVLQQPIGCLASDISCALQVFGSGFHYINSNIKLHAASGSTLSRNNISSWRLVKGALWVEKSNSLEIESLYATSKSTQGQYWVIDQGERVLIRNIDANLEVTLRDGKVVNVPEGFEFWVSGINSKGNSEYGMIQPMDVKSHLKLWNSLYMGTRENFLKEVTQLKDSRVDLIEKSSRVYAEVVRRELASELEKKNMIEQKKLQAAERQRQIKEIYRQRVFER